MRNLKKEREEKLSSPATAESKGLMTLGKVMGSENKSLGRNVRD